jgi:ABC-type multidrug transport system ATPase subunit
VILSFKHHSAMMLTTHSMEEAEALCDRVAIFTDGELRTIGTANELKARHGKGYKLTISVDPRSDERPVHAFVMQNFPGAALLNTLAGNMNYEVPRGSVVLSHTFDLMNANRERFAIKDWAIQNSTLEEVFLHIEERYRKDGAKDIVDASFTQLSK